MAIWGVGREAETALTVAEELARQGIEATVVNTRFVLPFDRELVLAQLDRKLPLVVIEDHCVASGFGAMLRQEFADRPGGERILALGWPREIVTWGTVSGLRARYGLDTPSLASQVAAHARQFTSTCASRGQEPTPGA